MAHALKLVGVDQRALIHFWIHAIAQYQFFLDSLAEFGYEGIVNSILDKDSVGADAGLSHIPELGYHHSIYGLVKVGRVENNEWSVAAQLQGQFLHRARALSVENLANSRGTCEG